MSAEHIKSAVIVTSYTDTVHLKFLPFFAFTAFETTNDQFVKVDWGVDSHVRTRLAERLTGKCEVKTINYNPADLARTDKAEPMSRIVERLKRVVPAGQADIIIFVDSSSVPFDKLNREEKKIANLGIGLVGGYNPTGKDGRIVHAFVRGFVFVLDGRTFETIAYRAGTISRSGHDVPPPIERLPFTYRGGGWAELGEEQRTQLRDIIFRMLDNLVTFTLGPHQGGVEQPPDALAPASTAEFSKLVARDAKRWNAVMAKLGLPSAP